MVSVDRRLMKQVKRSEVGYSTQLHHPSQQKVTSRYDKKVTPPKKVVHQKQKRGAKRGDKKLLEKSWSGAVRKWIDPQHTNTRYIIPYHIL